MLLYSNIINQLIKLSRTMYIGNDLEEFIQYHCHYIYDYAIKHFITLGEDYFEGDYITGFPIGEIEKYYNRKIENNKLLIGLDYKYENKDFSDDYFDENKNKELLKKWKNIKRNKNKIRNVDKGKINKNNFKIGGGTSQAIDQSGKGWTIINIMIFFHNKDIDYSELYEREQKTSLSEAKVPLAARINALH